MRVTASSGFLGSLQKPISDEPINAISLFSGAMGLDLGFELSNVDIRFACDNMPEACETIRSNRPKIPLFEGDVSELSGDIILDHAGLSSGEIDLVIGGPPCQSFSTVGRRRGLDDKGRGNLVFEFARIVRELKPRAFVMENVKGILSSPRRYQKMPEGNNGMRIPGVHGTLLEELLSMFSDAGYSVDYKLLNAADFGVPQARNRVFFVGFSEKVEYSFPEPTHGKNNEDGKPSWRTLGEAIGCLENDDSFRNKFSPNKLKWLAEIPPGGNWRNLSVEDQEKSMGRAFHAKGGRTGWWRRLSFDRPSPTLLTEPQNSSTSLCHPLEDRPLSVKEYARIQTFPDDWEIHGRGMKQYRLMGNAVPVLLSASIAVSVMNCLNGNNPDEITNQKTLLIDSSK